jgi:hypothetical protein
MPPSKEAMEAHYFVLKPRPPTVAQIISHTMLSRSLGNRRMTASRFGVRTLETSKTYGRRDLYQIKREGSTSLWYGVQEDINLEGALQRHCISSFA